MSIYKFKRLIDKYSVDCQLVDFPAVKWVAGKKVVGEPTTRDIKGAVVPITERRIYSSGGAYKSGDCEFITTETIAVGERTYIVHKGTKYKLEESTDYKNYADFNTYIARGVSAFDTAGTNTGNNT